MITIAADGSVVGTDKISRDGDTYTLTANLTSPIVIERDNVVLVGNGYSILALNDLTRNQSAISFERKTHVVVTGFVIDAFCHAIESNSSLYCTFSNNTIRNAEKGILFNNCQYIWVAQNLITTTSYMAVHSSGSRNILISDNAIRDNFGAGVMFDVSSNSIKSGCVISGNLLVNNSRSPDVSYDNIGVQASYVNIVGNYIANARFEDYGNFNNITKNVFYDCGEAVWLLGSNCTFTENNFTKNHAVVYSAAVDLSNVFYCNNFINNSYLDRAAHISYDPTGPSWDNGTVGNYYNDYLTQNPAARINASTGTYDTPYTITEIYGPRFYKHDFYDNHPLVKPVEIPQVQTQAPEWLETSPVDSTDLGLAPFAVAIVLLAVLLIFKVHRQLKK
ncbi:MAG: right-handed parallel beta-helix repeat-containing protein [Candidatus Bathyarchaeota archaeon]|nr:right-handed parallel beta-helix repeat-containing protein [Candidatus Bathyarchaeota archaeon]